MERQLAELCFEEVEDPDGCTVWIIPFLRFKGSDKPRMLDSLIQEVLGNPDEILEYIPLELRWDRDKRVLTMRRIELDGESEDN